ncbi:MAG: 50S ribosomal protein L15 [Candidatus Omnitrophota bacterium]|jgi:large subunit ribosomal protein L15
MEKKTVKKKTAKPALPKPGRAAKKALRPVKPVVQFGLHNLAVPKGAHKGKKILGRGPGSGHGKTSTRGSKGQTSRSGRDFYPGFEGGQTPLIRRIPKRGFTGKLRNEYQIVNLGDLNKIKAAEITPEILAGQGLIKDKAGAVKILGGGEIKNPVNLRAHAFSKQAADKIQKSGGKIEIISDAVNK